MGDEHTPVPQYYSDQFAVALGPYGCALTFGVANPEGPHSATPVASVRMSLEHLKAITYLLHRQILRYQQEFETQVMLPEKALEGPGIKRDDWQRFWNER